MRKFLLLSLLLFTTRTIAQKKWTLKECVERAIEKNISIKQSELNFLESEINKKNAIGNFIPNLNIGSSHSWNVGLNQDITTGILENITTQFTSMNLNVNVDVLNGLKNIKQLHLANLNILSNKFQLDDMRENISLLVANSFLQILFNKELLKVQKIQYDLSIDSFVTFTKRMVSKEYEQQYQKKQTYLNHVRHQYFHGLYRKMIIVLLLLLLLLLIMSSEKYKEDNGNGMEPTE